MRVRVAKDFLVAVATRADAWPACRRVARALRLDPTVTLEHDEFADRWRACFVIHDAVRGLLWPERKVSTALAAKSARLRKGDYLRVRRSSYSTLLNAQENGTANFAPGSSQAMRRNSFQ